MSDEGYDTAFGSMPSFFMREMSVVRLSPIRAAAPPAPPTRPAVSFKMRTISSRSFHSRVPAARTGGASSLLSSLSGTCSVVPRVRITARSMKFSSSRMFPGQCH